MEELIKTAGKKIDLLGFDACLMGMYEVAAASAFAADYMLGSSESEFAGEWAYATIIETLARTPSMTAPELGKLVADTYWARRMESAASEGDYYANVTMALYDLSQVSALQTKSLPEQPEKPVENNNNSLKLHIIFVRNAFCSGAPPQHFAEAGRHDYPPNFSFPEQQQHQ